MVEKSHPKLGRLSYQVCKLMIYVFSADNFVDFDFYADPDYHRAWLRHGSKRHVDLKVLISYLPTADFPLIEPKFIKKQSRGKRKSKSPLIIQQEYNKLQLPAENDLRLAATIIDECETEGQREEYISALQKHASVHIYGRCGAPCPGWVTEDCLRYLDKHYKVYIYQAQCLKVTPMVSFYNISCEAIFNMNLQLQVYFRRENSNDDIFGEFQTLCTHVFP